MNPTENLIDKEKTLVLAQLFTTDPKLKLSIGTTGGMKTYTRAQIIEHVQELDQVGLDFIETQMNFMRSLKSGDIHSLLSEIETED